MTKRISSNGADNGFGDYERRRRNMKRSAVLKMISYLLVMAMVMMIGMQAVSAAPAKTHLNKIEKTVFIGQTYHFKLISAKGKAISDKKIKWKSSDKNIVSVSKEGKAKGVKAGKATITAKYKGKSYKAQIKVQNSVSISKKTLNFTSIGAAKKITVTYRGSENIAIQYDSGNISCVSWKWGKQWDGNTIKLTIKAASEGSAKLRIYDKKYPKNYRILKINVTLPINERVARHAAALIEMEKAFLKNPSSLILNEVLYSDDGDYVIVDYSAMNGFGGYVRDYIFSRDSDFNLCRNRLGKADRDRVMEMVNAY